MNIYQGIKFIVVTQKEHLEFVRFCGQCGATILPGERAFYFHHEDQHDFCTPKCYLAYYASDEEVMAAYEKAQKESA